MIAIESQAVYKFNLVVSGFTDISQLGSSKNSIVSPVTDIKKGIATMAKKENVNQTGICFLLKKSRNMKVVSNR